MNSKRRRIVVKVGTSTVCHDNGSINLRRVDHLCRCLADLDHTGYDIILVTSGAIGAGVRKLGLPGRPDGMADKQAVSAVGQLELMAVYDHFFEDYGITSAQVLLTKSILDNQQERSNAIAAFDSLLKMNTIPVVNENDAIATEEIVYGDNDTLSAVIAEAVKANLLILLSDIDGLYDSDPNINPDAKIIHYVDNIDKVVNAAGDSHTKQGTGGMITKIHAAKIAVKAGIPMIVANGNNPETIYDLMDGKVTGTYFAPEEK
jgi:glutamate 5-kinase